MSAGTFDTDRFRGVMGHFATGVAVVTAVGEQGPIGMTIQSFTSLSLDPPLVTLCPARSSTTWPAIEAAGSLVVNVLAHDQHDLARQFARSGADKYAGIGWTPAPASGAPVLEGTLAWVDCAIDAVHPGGDHLIVVCAVRAIDAHPERRPLVFFRSAFGTSTEL
jgi:flavin reductase (DIM6/NTAB) family NADH-FMN oxidoreductase RutF